MMRKRLNLFLVLLVAALSFAAGTLLGPGQAQSANEHLFIQTEGAYEIRTDSTLRFGHVIQLHDSSLFVEVQKK